MQITWIRLKAYSTKLSKGISLITTFLRLLLVALPSTLAAAPGPTQMHFVVGSRCGLYVGKAPVELSLNVKAGQVVQVIPNQDPDQSKPYAAQVAYPGEDFSPALPAAFESRRVRGGGNFRYRILNGGTADEVDVRLCVTN